MLATDSAGPVVWFSAIHTGGEVLHQLFFTVYSLNFCYFCTYSYIQSARSLHHTYRFLSYLLIPFSLNIRTQSHIPIMCAIPPPPPLPRLLPIWPKQWRRFIRAWSSLLILYFFALTFSCSKETLPPILTHACFLQFSPLLKGSAPKVCPLCNDQQIFSAVSS